jgi:hypothetical protein
MIHPHEVYVVYWPEIQMVKVGATCKRRWRGFVARGAQVVGLIECEPGAAMYHVEADLRSAISHLVARTGFADKSDARPYLGTSGAGYMECRHMAPDSLLRLEASVRAYTSGQCLTAHATHHAPHRPGICLRTDERTHADALTLRDRMTLTQRARGNPIPNATIRPDRERA